MMLESFIFNENYITDIYKLDASVAHNNVNFISCDWKRTLLDFYGWILEKNDCLVKKWVSICLGKLRSKYLWIKISTEQCWEQTAKRNFK